MYVVIQEVSGVEISAVGEDMVGIYRAAFAPPPYNKTDSEVADFEGWLPDHSARGGFRLRLATDKRFDRPVGFAYGFDQTDDHYFREAVASELGHDATAVWLADYFRLVELAVLPEWQKRGLGSRLHDSLLCDLPCSHVVLATLAQDTPALHLYLNRGWQVFWPKIRFPSVDRPYQIMHYFARPALSLNHTEV